MENVSFSDFHRMDIRMGKIVEAEKAAGTDKLILMQVDFGSAKRQIAASIAEFYKPDELIGKECPFLFNLEPKRFMGYKSQGMLLAIDVAGDSGDSHDCVLLFPNKEVKPGAKVV